LKGSRDQIKKSKAACFNGHVDVRSPISDPPGAHFRQRLRQRRAATEPSTDARWNLTLDDQR